MYFYLFAEVSMDDKIHELEAKMTFLEDSYSQLNEVVVRQQRDISLLNTQLDQLKDWIKSLQESPPPLKDEPPPHY